jgi:hypothetical protein
VRTSNRHFRGVEVFRAYYDAFQDCLNQKYLDRETKEYDGSAHDVLSDKSDILMRTIPAEAENHEDRVDDDDGLEASNEDDSEIDSYFPIHSGIWICQLSGSRTSWTASLWYFSIVRSTIISRS